MWRSLVGFLLAVPLPFPFGDAEATALVVADDGSAVLEVTVHVAGAPVAVLVRGVGPLDELPPVALADRGNGIWSGLVQLRTTTGVLLAFEYLPGGGATVVSDLHTLIELGVDQAALVPPIPPGSGAGTAAPSTVVPPRANEPQWGWLAVAAGSAGLALLLLWLWLGRRDGVVDLSGTTARIESARATGIADKRTEESPAGDPGD